jgi:diguanylate cyclase (GGDEF)-like protein
MTVRRRTRTERSGNRRRPRRYGDRTSSRAAARGARSGSALAASAAAVLAIAVVALVALVIRPHDGAAPNAAEIAVGVIALAAALGLVRALALLRREHAALARREADALRMAELDDLTGLGNYRMFTRQLAAEVARSRRYDDPFSLVLLDLDGFKAINDELGHLAGDDALRLVAGALRGALREEDVCCRQGGDEFAVIAVRAGELEARDLSERLVHAIEAIQFGLDGERHLSASIGWATFGRPARSVDELVARADTALRQGKRAAAGGPGGPELRTRGRGAPSQRPLGRAEAARLALLAGIARALAGAEDERALAETTAAFLAGAFDTVGTAVAAVEPGGEVRLAAFGSGRHAGVPDLVGALAQRPIARRALAAAGPAVVEEDGEHAWVDGGAPVRSELAVAVLDEQRPWGYLAIASDRPRAYGIPERELAEAIAEQLGRGLTCRRLLDRVRAAGFGELYRVAIGSGVAAESETWRIAELAWDAGRALALDDGDLRALYLAALFHDVGTVGVPAVLLGYPGVLREEERAVLRDHARIGERLLRALPLLAEAAPIVRHEHERYDGAGYPDGLAGEEIPLPARILLACDAYVSMTSPRPWREPRSERAARAELRRVAGAQLDPQVVEALLDVLDRDRNGHGAAPVAPVAPAPRQRGGAMPSPPAPPPAAAAPGAPLR